jgi:pimeloyl-ACP methyl ester carboxylesterase
MRYVIGLVIILVCLAGVMLLGLRLAALIREAEVLPARIPEEGQIVETALGPIYFEAVGPEDGVPLLLVHGSVGWSRLWRPTAEALAAEGYRAIAFDMPPMGWSFRDPKGDYSRQTQAARLLALVDALNLRPVVIAHSFGAGPAAEAVMMTPEAFAGLVVVSGAVGLDSHLSGKSLPWPLGSPFLRELGVAASVTNPSAMGPLLRLFLHRKEAATEEVIAILNLPGSRAGTTAALADWLPSLLVPPTDALSTRPENWQALDLPLAFLWGDRDTATPLAQGQRLADLTGAPLVILEEVGHIPQIEAPAEFKAALLAALSSLLPSSPDP